MAEQKKTIGEFIKWCDENCTEHLKDNKYPLKHKQCKQCWEKAKQENIK